MICPQCGYDMGTKSKCLRCGYTEKTLAVVDESKHDEHKGSDEQKKNDGTPEVKVIDPCNVYLTHPYGYDDYGSDYGAFGSPFSSLFDDLFGDPIGDLLGGLFGFDMGGSHRAQARSSREEPQKRKRKQGPIVEMDKNDFEILDENGDPVEQKPKHNAHASEQNSNGGQTVRTHKNPFRRKPRK